MSKPIVVFIILLALSQSAVAYLDPGTGSLIFQLLIGSVVGILFAIRMYWARLKNLFNTRILRRRKDEVH